MKRTTTIDTITGVWKFKRDPAHYKHYASPPGHLLHLVISGSYHLRVSGRERLVSAGDLIYYYESEEYEWIKNSEQVVYISIGFMANHVQPPPLQLRIMKSLPNIRENFEKALQLSTDSHPSSMLKMQVEILQILIFIEEQKEGAATIVEPALSEFWWYIEDRLRQNLNFRPTMTELCSMGDVSSSTLIRKCKEATNSTPFKRLQKIRMQEAVGLLTYSGYNITKVSGVLGYKRIHEFSTEFSKYFGYPPTKVKAHRKQP